MLFEPRAAQKFVSDIAGDALHYCKVRQQAIAAKDKKGNVRVSLDYIAPNGWTTLTHFHRKTY